ncbi:hypothetical protein [Geopseudomonas aromaticivorans]
MSEEVVECSECCQFIRRNEFTLDKDKSYCDSCWRRERERYKAAKARFANDYSDPLPLDQSGEDTYRKPFLVSREFVTHALVRGATDMRGKHPNKIEYVDFSKNRTDKIFPKYLGRTPWSGRKIAENKDWRGDFDWRKSFDVSRFTGGKYFFLDVVTFPCYYLLTYTPPGLPDKIYSYENLWIANQIILSDIYEDISKIGMLFTGIHLLDVNIEDSPCHNYFCLSESVDESDAVEIFGRLLEKLKPIKVDSENPYMNDRCVLTGHGDMRPQVARSALTIDEYLNI